MDTHSVLDMYKQWLDSMAAQDELMNDHRYSHPFIGKPIKYQVLDQNGNVVEEKDLGVCTDISFDLGGQPINSNQPISFTFKGGS